MTSRIILLKNRIYADYFMKNRFEEYRNILEKFVENGFIFQPICQFHKMNKSKKCLFLRHDIDSEPEIAYKLFEIESHLGIKSTYYFRWYTYRSDIIQSINASGSEVGYHYEEGADFAKQHHIKQTADTFSHQEEIEALFCENIKKFELLSNFKLQSVASHGDWKNRQLQITNKALIRPEVFEKLGLIEAYDIEPGLDFRIADKPWPEFWNPKPPENILCCQDKNTGLILIHPRQWCSNPRARIKLDAGRILEAVKYR